MISADEAARALKEAAAAERKSAQLYLYRRASPYLYLWGAVWFLGYGASDLWPRDAGWIWGGLILAAMGVSVLIGRSVPLGERDRPWRVPLIFLAVWAFFAATYRVMAPVTLLQYGAFPPLVVALCYVAAGMFFGSRFVVAGAAIGALTMIGFLYMPVHFLLWQGLVGGLGLLLAGYWFRTA